MSEIERHNSEQRIKQAKETGQGRRSLKRKKELETALEDAKNQLERAEIGKNQ